MVLFININLNQRVEVRKGGRIYKGTVKYKGYLNGVPGEWVGVALDKPAGQHNGMLRGRRYFECMLGHGIFTHASNIRFVPSTRHLYHNYRLVEPDCTGFEEDLFTPTYRSTEDLSRSVSISGDYSDLAQELFPERYSPDNRLANYHLPHSVGNRLPAATMLRPQTARSQFNYTTSPIHREYYDELYDDDFIRSPSIPKTHMPHSALKRQVARGWERDHYVREMSASRGRDPMKYSQWNDY